MKKISLIYQLLLLLVSLSLVACSFTLTNGAVATSTTLLVSTSNSAPTSAPILLATDTPTPTAIPSPVLTLSPTPVPTPTPTSGVTEKKVGIINRFYKNKNIYYVDIDYVQFLTGDEAVEKAKADKSDLLIDNGDGTFGVNNDYYIANDSKKIRTFPMAFKCELKIVNWDSDDLGLVKVKISEFIATHKEEGLLVDIDVKNGTVISLVEIYTP